MAILIDVTVKTTLVIVAAAVGGGLMGRASAASRHLLWTAAFTLSLLLPVARFALPPIPVAVLAPEEPRRIPTAAAVVSSAITASRVASDGRRPVVSAVAFPATTAAVLPGRSAWPAGRVATTIWLLVAAVMALRIALGVVSGSRRAQRARPFTDAAVLGRLSRLRERLHVRRPIRLLTSGERQMPLTWGVVRPIILLPTGAMAWAVDASPRLDAVLAHETAHIARWDAVSHLIARLGVAMFWFNPLMWIASRQARLERERACDDAVLAMGTRPSEYAGHLVAVARSLPASAAIAGTAGLAMAQRSQLERRVRAILDEHVNRRGVSRANLVIASLLIAVMLPVSAVSLTARQVVIAPIPVAAKSATEVISPRLPVTPVVSRESVPAKAIAPNVVTPQADRPLADETAPIPRLVPLQAQPAPFPQIPPGGFKAATWREDRAALLQQLLERARQHHREQIRRVEIGTMASIETLTAETTIVHLEVAIAADKRAGPTTTPSDADLVTLTRLFDVALRNLDAEERRFAAGITSTYNLSTALLTAVNVLVNARFAQSVADDGAMGALSGIAMIASEGDRASALITFAQRNALTPEMVTLYVAAASGLSSAAERDRVFAQPIHVRP